jgi:hypothetical protein
LCDTHDEQQAFVRELDTLSLAVPKQQLRAPADKRF